MTAARVVLDLALVAWWVRTLVVLARRPARRWRTGRWGKAVALVVAALAWSASLGVLVPWGAVWMWWRVLVRARDPYELPMADGRPMP